MSYAPPVVVDGIARQPLSYGLFSVLGFRTTGDPHWQNGIRWETMGCDPASGIGDPDCDTPISKAFLPGDGPLGEATPFTVYASYECSPTGHPVDYAQQRATERLQSNEEARAEQAFWTGDLGNTGFATGAENVGAGTLRRSIARLEQWLATHYGSQGVLHMTREAALLGYSLYALTVKGSTLTTALGTPVVAGAGYPGTGPSGQAPGADASYLFATPGLVGYRSEIFAGADPVGAGLDRAHNDLRAVAERTYVLGYDPCGTAYALADFSDTGFGN